MDRKYYLKAYRIIKKLSVRKEWNYTLMIKLATICSEGQKKGYIPKPIKK